MDNKHLSNAKQKNGPRAKSFLSQALYPTLNALVLDANIHQVKSTKELQDHFHTKEFFTIFQRFRVPTKDFAMKEHQRPFILQN